MEPSSIERDPGMLAVLQCARIPVIYPNYHRPSGRHRRWRRAAATLAAALGALASWAATAGASTLVIEGAGYGHGVGMSQDGAYGLAAHGYPYQAILAHYYSATTLGHAPAGAVVRVLEGAKVVKVPLERYVRGVVSAEMPAGWPLAALEAQAVASRTYALTDHAGGSRFDVYSDTRSQVYEGRAAETAATNAAVAATAGQIVLYAGQPAITFFFASSGGITENVENAWPGSAPAPWLRGVVDPYESGPSSAWKLSIGFALAAARLAGLVQGGFRGIEVLQRGVSPRIVAAEVLGTRGASRISGPELAARLGLQSTWAYFSVKDKGSLWREPDLSGHPQASPPASGPTGASGAPVSSTPPPPPASGPQGGAQAPGMPVSTLATGGAAAH